MVRQTPNKRQRAPSPGDPVVVTEEAPVEEMNAVVNPPSVEPEEEGIRKRACLDEPEPCTESQNLEQEIKIRTAPGVNGQDVHFIVVGDPHFDSQRHGDTIIMSERVIAVVKKIRSQLDAIIILGDLVDRFSMRGLSDAEGWIYQLSLLAPLYLLVGNHDLASHADFLTGRHPFGVLGMLENVTVVDVPHKATIKGIDFLMVPYVPDGRMDEAIRTVDPELKYTEGCHTVFSHQSIYMSMYNNMRITHGDKWPIHFPFLVNGHIHEMGHIQANAENLGSPYQISHGEPENNAVMILRARGATCPDTKSSLQELLELPVCRLEVEATHKYASHCSYQLLALKVPAKRTVRLTYKEFLNYTYEEDPKVFQLRVVISGAKGEIEVLRSDKKIKALSKLAPRVMVRYKLTSVKKNTVAAAPKRRFLDMLKDGAADDMLALIEKVYGT